VSRWNLILLIMVPMLLLTSGCNFFDRKVDNKTETSIGDKPAEVVLRMGYAQAMDNPRHLAAQAMAKWVHEQSKGRIKIELYPNEMLAPNKEMTEMAIMGTLDLVVTTQGIVSEYEPKLAATGLPFLFDSPEKVAKVLDGPLGQEMAKDLPRHGLRILAYWDNGFRQFTTTNRPIHRPEDFGGLKIRVPEDKLTFSTVRALGANPIPMPFPELYIALSRGEVDGQENPIVNVYTAKLYEVQKYISIINYKYQCTPLVISEKTWRRLSPDQQRIVQEGAVQGLADHRRISLELDKEMLEELERKGMKVVRPDIAPFREATKLLYEEWASVIGRDLMERIIREAQ